MGNVVGNLQNTVDGLAQEIGVALGTFTKIINDLQRDASGTVVNVANECIESLRIITHQAEHSATLLTNGLLAMMTAIALSILLYLTHFSAFLRAIIWTMYASLCLHMIMTYVRHSRPQEQPESIEYRNQQLEKIITQSHSSSEIDLTRCKLNDENMDIIISQAINNQRCTSLKLICNQITSSGASTLADALLHNKTLKQLSLWKNRVGDQGVQSISSALEINRNVLKKLDLSQNDITDKGAEYLAQMLKTNRVLTHLTLSNNRISDRGLELLTDALQNRNSTLEALSLTGNNLLTDASVVSLITMSKNNRSLKKLWINGCNLSKSAQDRLQRAVRASLKVYT